jgi:dephospho-CoA kinase
MRLGLTGGIGSGKSTAAQHLVTLGWRLVDTDAIARQLTGPQGAALPAIEARFGADVFDASGHLDRAGLRARVFVDADAKVALESLLHPLILNEALQQANGAVHVVFDVPLLAESRHWRTRVDRVLVVDCETEVQVRRVAQRPAWTAEQARAVIASQATRQARRAVADAVIDNSHLALKELHVQLQGVSRLWQGPVEESTP